MIKVATTKYGIEKNDSFIDKISAISNFTCVSGEICGPILAGAIMGRFGFSTSALMISASFFVFAAIYFIGTEIGMRSIPSKTAENSVFLLR